MPKYIRIASMILLISMIMFPTSAFASSKESGSSQSSFLSSLSSRFVSLFTGHREQGRSSSSSSSSNNGTHHDSNHPSNNSNHNSDNDNFNYNACHSGKGNDGLWNWLGTKDCEEDDWWDDPDNDSYSIWQRYYCY